MRFGKIFGIEIAAGTRGELLSKCSELMAVGGAVSTVNPEILGNALKNKELYDALSKSLNIPDGIGVEKALMIRGVKSERFPGVELGEALLDIKPATLAIIGGEGNSAKRAMANLCHAHPLASPAFYCDGYNYSVERIVSMLRRHNPDIVFVCMGSPKQEIFIKRIRACSKGSLFVALGGSIDIYSGKKQRAPALMRNIGCEWVYRIIREPARIKRVPALFSFAYKSVKEADFLRKSAENSAKEP